jgi:hypothetical protein
MEDTSLPLRIVMREFRDALYQALGEIPEGFFIRVNPLDEHLSRSNPPEELFYKVSLHYNGPGYERLREWDGKPARRENGQACLNVVGIKWCNKRQDPFKALVQIFTRKVRETVEALGASPKDTP